MTYCRVCARRVLVNSKINWLSWRLLLACLAFLASANVTVAAFAQPDIALTLAEAEEIALQSEPGQVAYFAQAQALSDQSVVAGQLADPKLRLGLANFPIESGGFATEGMTQMQLGIRQSFPAGRTRALRTSQYQSQANEMLENANLRSRDVRTQVRDAWLETYFWREAIGLLKESQPFFEDLVTITRSLYAVGNKDQQDVLRAELELSRLQDRLIEADRNLGQVRARLSRWIGFDANRNLAKQLPEWDQLPTLEKLKSALVRHPSLSAASARIATQRAGINLAKESYKPGWALDLGYGYREGTLTNGNPRSDFVSVAVTFDIPLFRKNRQDRSLAAAHSQRDAAVASKDELLRRLVSELESEFTRWQDLSRRIALYERLILVQAHDQSNAALAAYQSEASDFADAMRGYVDDLDVQLDYVRLQVERAQSYAVIANLGGLDR